MKRLVGVMTKEKAQIGIFLCLEKPSEVMRDYAASAGLFEIPATVSRSPASGSSRSRKRWKRVSPP